MRRAYPGTPEVIALADATLHAATAEVVAVVGPSGAGKSTLLNLLGLLDKPTSGSYALAGQDTADLSARERDRLRALELGFVFQSYHVLGSRTVFENVWLKLATVGVERRRRQDLIEAVLAEVGLEHRTWAKAAVLSGGEKQRLAIARAAVLSPAVLLADEPTGNLDRENAAQVLDLLRRHASGGTAVVVITHDAQVASWADRVVSLSSGRTDP